MPVCIESGCRYELWINDRLLHTVRIVLTDQTALVAPEQCLPCPAGRVCPRQGIGRMQDTIACIEGYVCNEGTYPLISCLTSRALKVDHRITSASVSV